MLVSVEPLSLGQSERDIETVSVLSVLTADSLETADDADNDASGHSLGSWLQTADDADNGIGRLLDGCSSCLLLPSDCAMLRA